MKKWIAPAMQEMDVRLTAKIASTVEQYTTELPDGSYTIATYNTATHESHNGYICPIEKKDIPGS